MLSVLVMYFKFQRSTKSITKRTLSCFLQWKYEIFVEEVQHVQCTHPQLIDAGIDAAEHFSIFRSICKGSTARAIYMQVDPITLLEDFREQERQQVTEIDAGLLQ